MFLRPLTGNGIEYHPGKASAESLHLTIFAVFWITEKLALRKIYGFLFSDMNEKCKVVSIVNHRVLRTAPFNHNQCHRPVGDVLIQYRVVWANAKNEIKVFDKPYSWVNDDIARVNFPRLVLLYWRERTSRDFEEESISLGPETFTLPPDQSIWPKNKVKLKSLAETYNKKDATRNDLRVRFSAIIVQVITLNGTFLRPLTSIMDQLMKLKKETVVEAVFVQNPFHEQLEAQLSKLMASDSFQSSLETVVENISCYSYLYEQSTQLFKDVEYWMSEKQIRRNLDANHREIAQWNNYPEKMWRLFEDQDEIIRPSVIRELYRDTDWSTLKNMKKKKLFDKKKRKRKSKSPKKPIVSSLPPSPPVNHTDEDRDDYDENQDVNPDQVNHDSITSPGDVRMSDDESTTFDRNQETSPNLESQFAELTTSPTQSSDQFLAETKMEPDEAEDSKSFFLRSEFMSLFSEKWCHGDQGLWKHW